MKKKINIAFIVTCIFLTGLHAQSITSESDPSDIEGVWENNSKIISIYSSEDGTLDASITLKTFYTFYYDGTYPMDESINAKLVRVEDGLYTEYWERSIAYDTLGDPMLQEEQEDPVFKVKIERPMEFDLNTAIPAEGVLWLPRSNLTELSIDEGIIKTEVMGYYVDTVDTYSIRYWLADVAYSDAKVALKLTQREDEKLVYIDKYLEIGDRVYTSAMGLRTEVRNVTAVQPLNEIAKISEDNTVLVFGAPYVALSDIENVEDAILAHNSIPRPPRDGRARFVEPSIYKKLEEMSIEDFDNPYAPIQ